jgi:hypothetical protein
MNIIAIIIFFLLLGNEKQSNDLFFPWEKAKTEKIEHIAPSIYKIGSITIDMSKNEVVLPGKINEVTWVAVEYLAVSKGGKLHESIIALDSEPIHINLGLILIGLTPGKKKLKYQGDPSTPEGTPVNIFVEWDEEKNVVKKDKIEKIKETKRIRAEELVLNTKENKPMKNTHWVYTGSFFDEENRFRAQISKSVIAVYHDPDALIDNPLKEGGESNVYGVNKEKCPPIGTPVRLIIQKIK